MDQHKERSIDLKDLFFYILYHYKFILITAVCCLILGFTGMVLKHNGVLVLPESADKFLFETGESNKLKVVLKGYQVYAVALPESAEADQIAELKSLVALYSTDMPANMKNYSKNISISYIIF